MVTDFKMPNSGLRELRQIKKQYPELKILVITGIENEEMLKQIRQSEIDAVLEKSGESRQIIETIRLLKQGWTLDTITKEQSKPMLPK